MLSVYILYTQFDIYIYISVYIIYIFDYRLYECMHGAPRVKRYYFSCGHGFISHPPRTHVKSHTRVMHEKKENKNKAGGGGGGVGGGGRGG